MPITEKRIMIAMPYELIDKLDEEAKKRRQSRSALIRFMITDWLDTHKLSK